MRSKPSSSGDTGRGESGVDIREQDLELAAHRLRVDGGCARLLRRCRLFERLGVRELELGVVAVARLLARPEDGPVPERRTLDASAELDVLGVPRRVGYLCIQYERSDHRPEG